MQDKNQVDVKKIFKEICDYLNIKGIRALAPIVGVKESTLYTWVKRGKIADYWALQKALPDLNEKWLATGKGPMLKAGYKDDKNNIDIEANESERPLVRHYRTLAPLDDDILNEISAWVNDMEKYSDDFRSWFRLEFQSRFPEFDKWKGLMLELKKRPGKNKEAKIANG